MGALLAQHKDRSAQQSTQSSDRNDEADMYASIFQSMKILPLVSRVAEVKEVCKEYVNYGVRVRPMQEAPPRVLKILEDFVDEIFQAQHFWMKCMFPTTENENGDVTIQLGFCYFLPLSAFIVVVCTRLLDYQRLAGGKQFIDGLNKTIPLGIEFEKIVSRIITRKDTDKKTEKRDDLALWAYTEWIIMSQKTFVQAGNKEMATKRHNLYRKVSNNLSKFATDKVLNIEAPSACNCCGIFESTVKNDLRQCSRCMSALYCSKECQVSHWKDHKKHCKKIAK